jgi:hypothetical protein
LSPDGLFRWIDDAGTVMVESIWWEDGFPSAARNFEDEVGYGWLVVASASAWKVLAEVVGPCVDWVRVERSADKQDVRAVTAWRAAT